MTASPVFAPWMGALSGVQGEPPGSEWDTRQALPEVSLLHGTVSPCEDLGGKKNPVTSNMWMKFLPLKRSGITFSLLRPRSHFFLSRKRLK